MKKQSLILTCILLGLIWNMYPQPELRFKRYTDEDGLTTNDIMSVYQDHIGFMWFTPPGALSRFDGIQFKNYNHTSKPGSLGNGWVFDITGDKKNRLWLCMGNNIMIYNYETETFRDVKIKLPGESEKKSIGGKDLFCDSRGLIWSCSYETKVLVIDPDSLELIKQLSVISNPFKIFEDSNGYMWIGSTGSGLIRYNWGNGTYITYKYDPNDPFSLSNDKVSVIYEDKTGTIWVGTEQGGLNKYIPPQEPEMKGRFMHYLHSGNEQFSLSNNHVYALVENSEGNLCVGTLGGLSIKKGNTDSFFNYYYDDRDNETLNDNIIRCLYKDKTGNLWIGTRNGIAKQKKQNFRTFKYSSYKNSISSNKVEALYADKKDRLYVGTPLFIDVYNRTTNTFKVFAKVKKGGGNNLSGPSLVIYPDNDNALWIGTWQEGLNHIDLETGTFSSFRLDKDNPEFAYNNNVFDIVKDDEEHLWLGTWGGGLLHYNIKTHEFEQIAKTPTSQMHEGLISNLVRCLEKDNDGNIWIGTLNGLDMFTPAKPDTIRHFLSLGDNEDSYIRCIYKGKEPFLWVGAGSGLYRVHSGIDGIIIKKVYDQAVLSILEDNNSNLWIATIRNIIKIKNAYQVDENNNLINITMYGKQDGLQREYKDNMACKLKDGTMFFGGSEGLSMFHPDDIKADKNPPTVVLTNLLVHNQSIDVGDTINKQLILHKSITQTQFLELNYKNNAFTLKFAALHYNIPIRNRYAYKLQNYNQNWQYTDATKNEATFMNLPQGDYLFLVKASNSDGIWNEVPVKLQISILPPWWKTWWFRISLALLIITIIVSVYTYRVKALKRQKRVLEQKVAERTAELSEANSQLEEKQEEIMQQNEEIITVNNQLKTKNEEIETSRKQLEKAFQNISVISEFGQKITATFDLDAINKMIYDYISSLMDTSAFGVGIYNEKRGVIDFPYFMEKGIPVPYFFKDLNSTKSLSVRCFKNSEEIFINDLSTEYISYLGELPEVQTTQLPASVIHLPLIVEKRAIGTLTVNSFKKNAYDENDIANLRTLASYISIALDNSKAYRIIRSKNEQISGSIRYGKTIQHAMLPPKDQIDNYFENFILYRPKDIVSGDFYWFATVETRHALSLQGKPMYFLAVVDCTGHGVPGAFMSMIGSRLLNDIVIERKIYSPAQILDQLHTMIYKALRQDTTDNHDGMDVCLCCFSKNDSGWKLTYAGAKRPLLYYNTETHQIEEIHGTRRSIGGIASRRVIVEFSEETLHVNQDSVFYLSTDGLIDQCNPQKRKFSQKKLIDLLQQIHMKPLKEQKKNLETELDSFQHGFEQRDDITLLGVRVK